MLYHQVATERVAHAQLCVRSLNNLEAAVARVLDYDSSVGPPRDDEPLTQPHLLGSDALLGADAALHLGDAAGMGAKVLIAPIAYKA